MNSVSMSNYCQDCPYDPNQINGDCVCPFTTLYWQFFIRYAQILSRKPCMALQVRNLERLDKKRIKEINRQAETLMAGFLSCKRMDFVRISL